MTDREDELWPLLEQAQAGDQQAWGQLFELHQHELRRRVRTRLGPGLRAHMNESVDVLQSVWGEALGNLERFEYRGRESFLAWITGILRNKIARKAEAAARQGGRLDGSQADDVLAEGRGSSPQGPATEAGAEEERQLLRRAFAELDPPTRDLLEQSIVERRKHREIGETLGISEEAVRKRVVRARAELARALDRIKKR